MRYNLYVLSLLKALEDYIPYMSEEEIFDILLGGIELSPLSIVVWEMKKKGRGIGRNREVIEKAISRQK